MNRAHERDAADHAVPVLHEPAADEVRDDEPRHEQHDERNDDADPRQPEADQRLRLIALGQPQ